MESFFTLLGYATSNPQMQKLYVQLTPPDDLLHARAEVRAANAIAMDHPVLGRAPAISPAIERVQAAAPHLQVADVSPKLDELRWVKTAYELDRVRQSGRIGATVVAVAVAEAIKGTRPGYTSTRWPPRRSTYTPAWAPGAAMPGSSRRAS